MISSDESTNESTDESTDKKKDNVEYQEILNDGEFDKILKYDLENFEKKVEIMFENAIMNEIITEEYDDLRLTPQISAPHMDLARENINKFFYENLKQICYGWTSQATNHYLYRDKNNNIYCGYITPLSLYDVEIMFDKNKTKQKLYSGFKVNRKFLKRFYMDNNDCSKLIPGPYNLL